MNILTAVAGLRQIGQRCFPVTPSQHALHIATCPHGVRTMSRGLSSQTMHLSMPERGAGAVSAGSIRGISSTNTESRG